MMRFGGFGVVFCSVMLLAGCGDESTADKKTTQVVAKVNGEEVTVHQLNQLLSKIRMPANVDDQEQVKKKALENLIEKTLVLQAAKKVKLDRTPEVLSALEEAKRKVLIDSYVKRTLQGVGKPSEVEIQQFYNERPEFFAERKLFVFTQLAISEKTEKLDKIVAQVKSAKSVDKIVSALDKQKIVYKKMTDAKASEKLPAPILKSLGALKAGDIGFMKMSDGLLVIGLHKVINLPVTLEGATPVIARQLFLQSQKKASLKLVESLKEIAQIEYIGEFAPKP